MSKLVSIFGAYANKLQVVIDNKLDKFAPTWYSKYFDFSPAQGTLTYQSVVGRSRIEAAASVVNPNSPAPLRARQAADIYTGTIPTIMEKIPMDASDYRDFKMMQQLVVDDTARRDQLLDTLFGDVKKVGDSAHKRLDIMCLEAISTGRISLTIDNNPDGLTLENSVDLLMANDNRFNAAASWADAINATPIDDHNALMTAASAKGLQFSKQLMSLALFNRWKNSKQVKESLTDFYGKGSATAINTLPNINEYLTANQQPIIEIVDEIVGVEKDGKTAPYRPFAQDTVVYIPAGKLGTIKNALAIEQIQPVSKVSYGTFNRALISKWQDNEPFIEYTKVELNAAPAVDAIDSICLLKAVL